MTKPWWKDYDKKCKQYNDAKAIKPSKKQINNFLDVFERLEKFEATQRHVRKVGAFKELELIELQPDVKAVLDWLRIVGRE